MLIFNVLVIFIFLSPSFLKEEEFMSSIKRFVISIPANLEKKFTSWLKEKGYTNRSEAIRDLIRDKLVEEEWQISNKTVVGTISIVYSHSTRELTDKLTELQHKYYKNILSNLHIHMDEHNCLEVLVVKGTSAIVKNIANTLISTRGVKHGKLITTTIGKDLP